MLGILGKAKDIQRDKQIPRKTLNAKQRERVKCARTFFDRFDVARKMSAKFAYPLKMYASRAPNFGACVDNEAINRIQNTKIKTTQLQIGRLF